LEAVAHPAVEGVAAVRTGEPFLPYDWATRFEDEAKQMILAGDHKPLVNYDALGPDAALSIPTPDHYLPLLYVLATRQAGDVAWFPIAGVDGGSISMLSVQIG
jgi:4,5-DOPA dioxygenase extradiol